MRLDHDRGSVFEMPATIHHFGWTTEETIIQEHGIGPLSVNYLKAEHEGDLGKHAWRDPDPSGDRGRRAPS